MAEAGESVGGLAPGSIRLKWPNDLVIEDAGEGMVRKLAGVLGETDGLGTDDPRAIVGIGVNADWAKDEFPTDLAGAMTSLRVAGRHRVDAGELLDAFVTSLESRVEALRADRFDAEAWAGRQVTTEREIELIAPDGAGSTVRATGVDPDSGALLVADAAASGGRRAVVVGEIGHVRLAPRSAAEARV
jgi:BirA family biotin operon repressor/biotin-[acetyl-CoA-carboxylase] ligase